MVRGLLLSGLALSFAAPAHAADPIGGRWITQDGTR